LIVDAVEDDRQRREEHQPSLVAAGSSGVQERSDVVLTLSSSAVPGILPLAVLGNILWSDGRHSRGTPCAIR
jgi:hypothetical protein